MLVAACGGDGDGTEPAEALAEQTIQVISSAFEAGGPIPVQYTCDGENKSPELAWSGVPDGTVSLALIVDDPDAPSGDFVHWVLYAIPADLEALPGAVLDDGTTKFGARNGRNDFGDWGYGGPCPPRGSTHTYLFKLYALDSPPDLGLGASKADLLKAVQGHVVSEGRLTGTYSRQ